MPPAAKAKVNNGSKSDTPAQAAVTSDRKEATKLPVQGATRKLPSPSARPAEAEPQRQSGAATVPGEIYDAAVAGELGKVHALINSNPDLVLSKDNQDRTPLHFAAVGGHKDVAALLLASGADVNAKDKNGWTPLHWAAERGHKDVAQLLLASKAEVNAQNSTGATPLHFAAASNHRDVVELLLANGAAVDAKNSAGATPLRWASLYGNKGVAELLRQHGGHQ